MRRIVIRCLWGSTVLVLVATLILSGATIGTTIAASIASPAAPVPVFGFGPPAQQPPLTMPGVSLR
jgi:hypothetical protein